MSLLIKYLSTKTILSTLMNKDKYLVIEEMVEHLVKNNMIKANHSSAVISAWVVREKVLSTGMDGYAMPHASLDFIDSPIIAFARSHEGIDWLSIDEKKINLIFFVLTKEFGQRLKICSRLSRLLHSNEFKNELITCKQNDILSIVDRTENKYFAA